LGRCCRSCWRGGALGAGAIGNVLNAKTQSDYVKQMIEWRKQAARVGPQPRPSERAHEASCLTSCSTGVDPAYGINKLSEGVCSRTMSQGIDQGSGQPERRVTLASRGLNLSPGATTDILAQSLAPYQTRANVAGGERGVRDWRGWGCRVERLAIASCSTYCVRTI
jgi:hypothetical protein